MDEQEQLIAEIRTRLQNSINVNETSNLFTETNEHQRHSLLQIKQELQDLRYKIKDSNQLNTIHKFNLSQKLKSMICRTNSKITTNLKSQNKTTQHPNQTENEHQQQLISSFFKPQETRISVAQTEATALESIQRQTQEFNSND